MTNEDVKTVLRTPYKPLALCALSYVNLTDKELNLLIMRHMRGHSQEETAWQMGCSSRVIQRWEHDALDKCCKAWENLIFIEEILKAAQQ